MTNPPYCLAFCFLDFCLEGGNCPKIKQNPNPSPTWKIWFGFVCFGDPYGTRTHVTAVKGRCLNHLTNGPEKRHIYMCLYGSGTWIRTGDTSGMNRMLWPTELCRHMLFKQHRDFIRRHARCQQTVVNKIFPFQKVFYAYLSALRQRDTPQDRRARR